MGKERYENDKAEKSSSQKPQRVMTTAERAGILQRRRPHLLSTEVDFFVLTGIYQDLKPTILEYHNAKLLQAFLDRSHDLIRFSNQQQNQSDICLDHARRQRKKKDDRLVQILMHLVGGLEYSFQEYLDVADQFSRATDAMLDAERYEERLQMIKDVLHQGVEEAEAALRKLRE